MAQAEEHSDSVVTVGPQTDMDAAHMKQDSLYPFNTCVCLELDDAISARDITKALAKLQPLHPKLNMRIGPCQPNGDISFIPKQGLVIEVDNLEVENSLALERRIPDETERAFAEGFALLRLLLITSLNEQKNYVLFVHSHAIMDGVSLLAFINAMLHELDHIRQEQVHKHTSPSNTVTDHINLGDSFRPILDEMTVDYTAHHAIN
jgi:hypothetical protein